MDQIQWQNYPHELRIYFNYYVVFKFFSKEDTTLIDVTNKVLDIKTNEPHRAYDGNGEEISFEHVKDNNDRLKLLIGLNSGSNWNSINDTKFDKINQIISSDPESILKGLGLEIQVQTNKIYPISFIIKNKDKNIGIYSPTDRSNIPKAQIPFIELAKKHLNLDEIWFYNNNDNYVNGNYLDNESNLKLKSIFSKFIVLDDIKQTMNILSNIENLSLAQKKEALDLLPIKI